MNVKIKTAIEIIDETVEFYSVPGRRSVQIGDGGEETGCLNNSPTGNHCAFARLVKDDLRPRMGEGNVDTSLYTLSNHLPNAKGLSVEELLEKVVKPEYAGHPIEFYRGLQTLHDSSSNWDPIEGLTIAGHMMVNSLQARYGNTG